MLLIVRVIVSEGQYGANVPGRAFRLFVGNGHARQGYHLEYLRGIRFR